MDLQALMTSEKLTFDGQNAKDFRVGERRVEKVADLDVFARFFKLLAEELRKKHEVVIVDPDQVAFPNVLQNGVGEEAVDQLVCLPIIFVKHDVAGMVME